MTLLLLLVADLFQPPPEESGPPPKDSRSTRLALSLNTDFRPDTSVQGTATFSLPLDGGFSWFGFDLNKDFHKTIAGEIRDQLTDYLIDELSEAPMTLLCQISPTTCDNLKHFRLTSRQQMKMNQDLVHAVERRNGDTPGALLAGAIKSCLHERRRRGDTLSEAVRNCAGKNGFIRTLAGEAAEKYDLGADLSLTLDLDEKTAGAVSRVTGKRNVSEGTLQDEFRPATLVNEYRTLRDQHLETWTRAIEEPEIAQPLPFSPSDLQTLRNVSPASRRTLLNSLASSRALVDLTRQVHDVERVLESAMQSPHADEEMRRRLTNEKERLSSELRRLVEEHEREKEHRSLLLKVLEEAENDQFRRINPVLQRQARERHFRRNRAAERPVSPACPSNSQDGMESEQAKR